MDHGKLTDNNGKQDRLPPRRPAHDEQHRRARAVARGAGLRRPPATSGGDTDREYKQLFSPEFRNRLDAKIGFAPLDPAIMGSIVDKFMSELGAQLAERKVTIELTEAAREYLAKKGYDPDNGARPLARVIQDEIKRPLGEELLFGKLASGGYVGVDVADDKVTFDFGAAS